MSGHGHKGIASRVSIPVAALVVGFVAACTPTPCKEGDSSRFKCDPTAMALDRLALRQSQTPIDRPSPVELARSLKPGGETPGPALRP